MHPIDLPATSRRRFLALLAAGGLAAATPLVAPRTALAAGAPRNLPGHPLLRAAADDSWLAADEVARTYYEVLLRHTRWSETQWNGNGPLPGPGLRIRRRPRQRGAVDQGAPSTPNWPEWTRPPCGQGPSPPSPTMPAPTG